MELEPFKNIIAEMHSRDQSQLNVIFSDENRIIVEAPAGYGKTNTMVSRIAYLILSKQIPNPKKILALSFSVNASQKIKKDIEIKLPDLLQSERLNLSFKEKLRTSNYHGFCRSVLKKYGRLLHLKLNEIDSLTCVDENASARQSQNINGVEKAILKEFADDVKSANHESIKRVIDSYDVIILKMLNENIITYNSILTLTAKLFKTYPHIKKLYNKLFPVIVVDEFQDTNILSWNLLLHLIGDNTKLLMLGDTLQRIYGFIGAMPNIIENSLSRLNMRKYELSNNYRFGNNENLKALEKIIRAVSKGEEPILQTNINLIVCKNQSEEANAVRRKAESLLSVNPSSTIAVLVKMRSENVQEIIKAFKENNISYFYALYTDDDVEYVEFHNMCLIELGMIVKITRQSLREHFTKMKKIYSQKISETYKALLDLLSVFYDYFMKSHFTLSYEARKEFIQDVFSQFSLKQYISLIDTNIIIATIHAAKGLEWDYVILPDMEKSSMPHYYAACKDCIYGHDCKDLPDFSSNKAHMDEISTFYVAVTRARKDICFTASLTNCNNYPTNISCYMHFPGFNHVTATPLQKAPSLSPPLID